MDGGRCEFWAVRSAHRFPAILISSARAPALEDAAEYLTDRFAQYRHAIRFFAERRKEVQRFILADMRRQGRHVAVDDRFENDRAIGAERAIPSIVHLIRPVYANAQEPERLSEAGVGKIG